MDDLVQFLRARLDEDEQTAREAGGRWMVLSVTGWVHTAPVPSSEWLPPGADHHVAAVPLEGDRAHIVRHDPARVLREVDAKRGIIEAHGPRKLHPELGGSYQQAVLVCRSCGPSHFPKRLASHHLHPCRTLRLLALPYADHPGYRPEWRP